MRSYFVDTNIWLDWILMRQPNCNGAIELIELAEEHKLKLFISTITVSTLTYFLQKVKGVNSRKILNDILSVSEVLATDKKAIQQGLSSRFADHEDSFQYFTATNNGYIDGIVTNNKKAFKLSIIAVYSASEVVIEY